MDAASISGSSGSLPEPADLGLGLHKRGRAPEKAAGLAEAPTDLPAFGKGNTCNVCSGDYYGDCDFYSVKVPPAARAPEAPLVLGTCTHAALGAGGNWKGLCAVA